MDYKEYVTSIIGLFKDFELSTVHGNYFNFTINQRFSIRIYNSHYVLDDFLRENSVESSHYKTYEELFDELIIFKELQLERYLKLDKDDYIEKLKENYKHPVSKKLSVNALHQKLFSSMNQIMTDEDDDIDSPF